MGVKDAREIAGGMIVWFEGFLVDIPRCPVRQTLIEILFVDDVVLVERLEVEDIAHGPPMIPRDALNRHIARGPYHEITPVHPDRGHCP